jgi:glutamyl-tRNA synthetase
VNPKSVSVRTRFAPSPTGDLHLGGVWTALASRGLARRASGALVLRLEDLDPPRVVRGAAERIFDDLRWLGIAFDEGPETGGASAPYVQSERAPIYAAALAKLSALGATYPCDCSRAEIARVASAPHEGEEIVYPGLCRDLDPSRAMKRQPAIRLRVDHVAIAFEDGIMGAQSQRLDCDVGDFVLRRGDGVFAYQLAVIVDDLAMRISDVVRGADLLSSTPRQVHLARLLGGDAPRYWHVPLVVGSDGQRLAKRTAGAIIRDLRERGISPGDIVDELTRGLGVDGPRWRTDPWPIPARWT